MEVRSTVTEAVGVANEVRGFWSKLFGAKQDTPKPVAKKKEAYVAVDETQVMADIVTQLSQFFKLQEQLAAHRREEEEKRKATREVERRGVERRRRSGLSLSHSR